MTIIEVRIEIASIKRDAKQLGYMPDAARIRMDYLVAERRTMNVAAARRAARAKRERLALEAMERRLRPVGMVAR